MILRGAILWLCVLGLAPARGTEPPLCPALGAELKSPNLPALLRAETSSCEKNRSACKCWRSGQLHAAVADRQTAAKHFSVACEAGSKPACYELGLFEFQQRHPVAAANHLRGACDSSANSDLCEVSKQAAEIVNSMAGLVAKFGPLCTQGNADACVSIGKMLDLYSTPDEAKAFFVLACKAGSWESCAKVLTSERAPASALSQRESLEKCRGGNLGYCAGLLGRRTLTAKTSQEIAGLLKKHCEATKTALTCSSLSRYFAAQTDPQQSLTYAKLACLSSGDDSAAACRSVGEAREQQSDPEEARVFYKKACDGEDALGCERLGTLLAFRADLPNAEGALRKACSLNYASACTQLAKLLYSLERNDEARRFARQGCELGDTAEGCSTFAVYEKAAGNAGIYAVINERK